MYDQSWNVHLFKLLITFDRTRLISKKNFEHKLFKRISIHLQCNI